ncbi:MAG: hypothetical protein KJ593_00600 [Candidatus Omnitrophica bacterium]|nr:hypothetical protein [Candidatus Omnitrophota bacterium]
MFPRRGITLIELAITSAIIIITFVAFLFGIVSCFKLAQVSKESFFVLYSASAKMEEIRGHNFIDVYNYYNGHTFEVAELPAGSSKGTVTIDNSNPDLLKAYIAVCWRSSDGRVIGEDANLDGILDPAEDTNPNNNKMDSPVTLASYVTRR